MFEVKNAIITYQYHKVAKYSSLLKLYAEDYIMSTEEESFDDSKNNKDVNYIVENMKALQYANANALNGIISNTNIISVLLGLNLIALIIIIFKL